jgi:hypothetical protein
MFHPDQIINGKGDEAMNDAGGDYMVGKEDISLALDHIGGLADQCKDSKLPGLRLVWRH